MCICIGLDLFTIYLYGSRYNPCDVSFYLIFNNHQIACVVQLILDTGSRFAV